MAVNTLRQSRLRRFDYLIERGEALGETIRTMPGAWEPFESGGWRRSADRIQLEPLTFMEWRADCVLFLSRVIPQGSANWHVIHELRGIDPHPERLAWALGFLRAFRSSYAEGLLEDQALVVEKGVFMRLLNQAQESLGAAQPRLFEHLSAAMLAAAVLDAAVRAVCLRLKPPIRITESNGEPVPLAHLIASLRTRTIIEEDQSTALLSLAAVHGHVTDGAFDAVDSQTVGTMVKVVCMFVETMFP